MASHIERQEYYRIGDGDVFDFIATLPLPADLPRHINAILPVMSLYATAFRYARRCLWKGPTVNEMAEDARKAAVCFARLAELLAKGDTHGT